jgi:LmbE family N-acetylglucosaminyl deacetylase
MFKDASIREQAPPVPGRPVFVWQFPVVAFLLALSILFRQSGVVREDRMLLAKASELQRIELEHASQPNEVASASPEPLTLVQRIRWVLSGPGATLEYPQPERRIAEADTVPESTTMAEPSVGVSEMQGSQIPKPQPIAETPVGQVPAVAVASAGQPPPVTETVSGQQVPVREPVPASEPPPETTAEVPAPRVVDVASATGERPTPAGQRATQEPRMLQASVLGAIAPSAIHNNGINPLEGLSIAKPGSAPEIGRVKVRVVPPGRPVEYFKADILFIHAHPDDESIDFGSLMAMASRGNQRIVTLLFTDGESGLDLYPQRKVGDIYPARALTGGALSQVRVVEATRALSVLGAQMYIRWGLTNRPYNTKADEVSPDEVIRTWGGEEALVRRLIEVLEGFRPSIVVSPDRKSGAYEHFEHEAVGQVVQTALERLRHGGGTYVKAHLVSVDPYQVDRYDGVLNVDARARDEVSGMAYRSIQAAALKEHVTQRDASMIGVSRLSHLDEEYYKALYWDLELSFQEFLEQISR